MDAFTIFGLCAIAFAFLGIPINGFLQDWLEKRHQKRA
jgi:hypothetical protein